MSGTANPGDLVTPFGEDLAVAVEREVPAGMAGTIAETPNPRKTQGGDTIDDTMDDPDPGPA